MGSRSRSRSSSISRRSRSHSKSRDRERKRRSRSRTRSTYSRTPSPNNCKRLHVANLDDSVRRRDIEDAFGKFGRLSDVWVASYPPFYSFVVYEKGEDASEALKEMRSGYVRNCHIRTTVALPRQFSRRGPPQRRYGGYGGGYGGGDRFGNDRYRRRSRTRSPRRHRRTRSRSRTPLKKSSRRSRSRSRSSSR